MFGSKISLGLLFGLLSLSPLVSAIVIDFNERKVIPAVPALNPVGTEKGLLFNSWSLNQLNTLSLSDPPSNAIISGFDEQTKNGTAFIRPVSPYKSVDLLSFDFALVAPTQEGTVGAPVQGTLTVAGFQGNREVAVASYAFTPSVGTVVGGGSLVKFIPAQLPSTFRRLTNITFQQNIQLLQVIVLDNLSVNLSK